MSNIQNEGKLPSAKKSVTETGHAINIGNFALLIQAVEKLKGAYNPSNANLEIVALKAIYNDTKAKLDESTITETNFDIMTANRSEAFKYMKKLSTKAHRNFKASQAPQTAKDHAQSIMNKLRGGGVSKLKKNEILNENDNTSKSISNSQQSYIQQIEHFKKLREFITSHQVYGPNEEEITSGKLMEFEARLNDENNKVNDAITTWRNTRHSRRRLLYTPDTGLVDIALAVKNYVASIFESNSPEFKEISKIKFRNFKN